jgi:hypothetical protein
MKMKATIEVEFEADEGQSNPQHMLEVGLTRAVGQLPSIIEHGITGTSVPTGIKRDRQPSTTTVTVVSKQIVP